MQLLFPPYIIALMSLGVMSALPTSVHAQVFNPRYQATFADATTGDNQFSSGGQQRWTVDPGADDYFNDVYERPMNQTFVNTPNGVATESDYFGNLDIREGSLGVDDTFLYASILMWDTSLHKSDGGVDQEGLKYQYSFRMGLSPNGSQSFLFRTDDPASQGIAWHTEKNFGYFDANGDFPVDGNGYETNYVSDGRLESNGQDILWTRIDPTNSARVEFVLNYRAMGFSRETIENLGYFVFESNKGLTDPGNYQWNKEYTFGQAGTPYTTAGLGNIYELDTLNGNFDAIPEPSSLALLSLGSLILLRRKRPEYKSR